MIGPALIHRDVSLLCCLWPNVSLLRGAKSFTTMPDSALSGRTRIGYHHSDHRDGYVTASFLEDRRPQAGQRRLAADELSAQEYGHRSNHGWPREGLIQIPVCDRDQIGRASCRE